MKRRKANPQDQDFDEVGLDCTFRVRFYYSPSMFTSPRLKQAATWMLLGRAVMRNATTIAIMSGSVGGHEPTREHDQDSAKR